MFFKVGVLKNFAILGPLSNKFADLLFQKIYAWLLLGFRGSKYVFSAEFGIWYFPDSRTGFCSGLLWKYELNLRSIHWSCSVKKGVLRNFANFTGKQLWWSLFLTGLKACNFIKKRLQHRCFPLEFKKFLRTPNLKSENDYFWNLFFHLDCPF